MNVSRVYTRDVIAIPRSTSLKEAARLMCAHHVGSLVITDDPPLDRRALGIITDRDLVVQAVAAGADPNETAVAGVMTPQLARVAESADAHRALEKMAELGIRRLAVTRDSGEIVGILSFDDLVDGFAVESPISRASFARNEAGKAARHSPISPIRSPDPSSAIGASTTVDGYMECSR
ncbi:MAG: CBS domain-containing protein [Burkholderiales bacterium]